MRFERRNLWIAAASLLAGTTVAVVFNALGIWIALGLAVLAVLVAFVLPARDETAARATVNGAGTPPAVAELARSILEPIPDPLMLLDASGRALFANRAMRDVVGTEIEHKHVSSFLRTPVLLEAIERTQRTGEPEALEFSFRVPVERFYQGYVARTASGVTLLVLHDLTAAKRAEQMRADFVANASHELRTPLAAVSGFIDTLRGHARDDSQAREQFLGIMSEEAGRMRRLIDDLLSLTRIELNEHVRPSTPMRIEDAVRDAAAALAPLAEVDDMRIEIEPSANLPPVLGERDELIQLFQNLIHNAIKYGGHVVHVSFGTAPGRGGRQADSMVFASIRDDGEGIPADAIPRLTERFYRVDVKRSRERGGTGLGLAIVKHILNRHQGHLQIESKPGEGSAFTVFLPSAATGTPGVTEVL